ncbi:MAG: SDR family oxidoreductase [Planctomycetes bacterium]|nr:SDR family oxidoreductase [Planctomycetota bacterium]
MIANRLENKNAFVTGGSRGIGFAIARRFAREGAGVALLSRSEQNLEAARQNILSEMPETDVVLRPADVTGQKQVEKAVNEALDQLGHVDILVNSAGVASLGDIDEMSVEQWEYIMAVNIFGAYYTCRAVWPHFKERGGGSIINLASGSGRRAHAGWSAYCTSKFAVMGLTDSLQKEGRPHGIRCNVICPGPTETDQRRSNFGEEPPEKLMQPEQIAEVAVFFASDESKWVSGPGVDVRKEPI